MKKINFRYLFYPFLAFLLGLCVARKLFAGNVEYIMLISTIAIIILIFCLCKKAYKPLLAVFICFAIGNGYYFIGMKEYHVPSYSEEVSVVGRVSDCIADNGYNYTILLENVKINGRAGDNVYLSLTNCDEMPKVGSFLAFESKLQKVQPFTLEKFNSTTYRNGVRYYASADFDYVVVSKGYQTFDEKVRLAVKELLYNNMSDENAGTAYAVLFGDKNNLDEGVYNSYREAGIIHVLTVSGLHVGFLITLVFGFLKICRVNKYVNFSVTTMFIAFYAYLCGFTPSVLRAGIMSIIFMISKLLYRKYDGLSCLGLAGFVLCLTRPLTGLDIGFQMSVFCVMAIFVLMPILTNLFKKVVPEKIASLLAVSISSQVGILPMLCLMGGKINLLSVFANLIIVPTFSLLYPVLFVISMLGTFLPFLGKLLIVLDFAFTAIFAIASFFALSPLKINLKEMDFAKVLLFYLIFFVLSDYFMVFPKERSLIFALLVFCYSVVFAFYAVDNSHISPISYISQYNQSSVIVRNSKGNILVVGDCYLINKFSQYADEKFDIFVETESLSKKRSDVYQNMGVQNYISCEKSRFSETTLISAEEDYVIGGYCITYLESGGQIMGVRLEFDGKNIFIATSEEMSYNTLKGFDDKYNFDLVFAEKDYQNMDFRIVSLNNKNSDYCFGKYGNMSFKYVEGQWKMRRID